MTVLTRTRRYVRTSIAGDRKAYVHLENPSDPVADGDGGFTNTWADLSPAYAWASIESATDRNMERIAAGTVVSSATHILGMAYHDGVTTKTRITYNGRIFQVIFVVNFDERNVETIAICTEVVA